MAYRDASNAIVLESLLRNTPCGACGKLGGFVVERRNYDQDDAIGCKHCRKVFIVSRDTSDYYSTVAALWVAPLLEIDTKTLAPVETVNQGDHSHVTP